jgi:ABC-type glycerol-3-phosphate transport system substrate-binding protein
MLFVVLAAGLALVAAGCGGGGAPPAEKLEFWHTRTGGQQKALEAIVADFNRTSGGRPIVPVYVQDYPQVRTKVMAGIDAKRLPLLSVCYETHVQAYAARDAVVPLDRFLNDTKEGLPPDQLADFYPQVLETNRFRRYNNQLLSFPFTKSLLLLNYNKTLLATAGLKEPPATWHELRRQAAKVMALTGKTPFPFVLDASTLDGMIFSFGGEIVSADERESRFDQPPTVGMLTLLRDMAQQKLLTVTPYQNLPGLFGGGEVPLALGTSSFRSRMEEQVQGKFDWDVAIIPHAEGVTPVTVLYGPNICLFKHAPEEELLGWRFIKYFTSPDVTARWSRDTGYFPVRKSASELPEMKSFYEQNPRALHALEILPNAKVEPQTPDYEEVRDMLVDAASRVINGRGTPEEVAKDLKKKADGKLRGSES